MNGKRFLIVTASVGSGHEKAAAAISQGISDAYPDAFVRTVDFMAKSTSWLNAFMKACYLNMLNFMPNLYEFIYNFTAGPKRGSLIQTIMAAVMAQTMKGLINEHQPDVIICTHPFPADAVSHLSYKWRKRFLSAAQITDYSVHPMWVCPNMNLYFVACSSMREALAAEGITKSTIHVTGIPVDKAFSRPVEPEILKAFKKHYGISGSMPVILIMGGGLGLGGISSSLDKLEKVGQRLQLLVVAGRNRELAHQARAKIEHSHHIIKVWDYTDEIRIMMECADLLVSKPGALTLTEAMLAGLPMLLHEPIPGPETDNAIYMSDCGIARWIHSEEELAVAIEELVSHPEKLAGMSRRAEPVGRPDVISHIIASIKENYPDNLK